MRYINLRFTYLLTYLITFRVSHRRREMYIGHARLRVSVSVCPSPYAHTTAWTRM